MSERKFQISNDLKLYCDNICVADLNLKIGQNVLIEFLNNNDTKLEILSQKIEDKNKYQQVLEAKIRRLKERIKVLENVNKLKKLSEENEKLKKEIKKKDQIIELYYEILELNK